MYPLIDQSSGTSRGPNIRTVRRVNFPHQPAGLLEHATASCSFSNMLATTTIPASQLPSGYFSSALSPVSAIQQKKSTSTLSFAMNPSPYNGRCKYKSGRCMNERTLKENGEPHTLCEEHRLLHNKNQRKSDTKRRRLRRALRNNESQVKDEQELCLQVTPLTLEESQLTAWTEEELHILAVLLEMPIVSI